MSSPFARVLLPCVLTAFGATLHAQNRTPTEYKVTVFKIEMSIDGQTYHVVMDESAGRLINLVDASTFNNAFASNTPIPAGTYKHIRMTLDKTLVWSHPAAPVSKSNQSIKVDGPTGPTADQMTVYFATHDQGGRPSGRGGGEGTATKPFLLGASPTVVAGGNTTLRMVFAVTATLKDQGGGNYDLLPPQMFFVSENGNRSAISGTFNSVLYNSVKDFTRSGNTYVASSWKYTSGTGTLSFDGAGNWTWSGKTNDFDLKNGATGSINSSASASGTYGVNDDGSFWMLATGEPGTLRGAISSDGDIVVATMYDSQSSHMMFFGVKPATSAAASTMSGNYYFTKYGTRWNSGSSRLDYDSTFGIVSSTGNGSVSGTSDSNRLGVTNPTTSPTIGNPTATVGSAFSDTISISANGAMTNTAGKLGGAILANGDAACIAWDFGSTYAPTNEFGFFVKQSPSGTFSNSSLTGTYFGGHFGDVKDNNASNYFSGFFEVRFNGTGSATVTLLENREGSLAVETFAQNYSVDTASGIVSFSDPDSNEAGQIRGAIGPSAKSFILSARITKANSQANEQRFLGLGLKQN